MSYASAKRNYEAEKFEVSTEPVLKCRDCFTTTTREEASGYGLRCTSCYNVWCNNAPRYVPQKDYPGDTRGWARRILDKRDQGLPVGTMALKMAEEALKGRA